MAIQNEPRRHWRAAEAIAARVASDLLESRAPAPGRDQTPDQTLQVFVVHQDLGAGLRASQALEGVRRQLNRGPFLHLSWWRAELLEDAGLRREAVGKVACADIIFLSLQGDSPLPPGLRHWFEQWTRGREARACVLVASFDERHRYSESARKVLEDLHKVAAARGLEVIPHFDFTPPDKSTTWAVGSAWEPCPPSLPSPPSIATSGWVGDLSAGQAGQV